MKDFWRELKKRAKAALRTLLHEEPKNTTIRKYLKITIAAMINQQWKEGFI
jgi:hypothetical protein